MTDSLTPRADRAVLLELAERCELEYPSPGLGADIARACGWCGTPVPDNCVTSIDAAAELMPADFSVNVITGGAQGALTYVEVFISGDIHWTDSNASTEPLARCAAALRARAGS